MIVGCQYGEILEVDLPEAALPYTNLSYRLEHVDAKVFKFVSIKSSLRRAIYLAQAEDRKFEKKMKKVRSLEKLRKENPDIKIDEETFLGNAHVFDGFLY